jgi:hypothetical protein
LAGNFIMTFSGPCLMTVRNFSRTVLTCSMQQIAGRTVERPPP